LTQPRRTMSVTTRKIRGLHRHMKGGRLRTLDKKDVSAKKKKGGARQGFGRNWYYRSSNSLHSNITEKRGKGGGELSTLDDFNIGSLEKRVNQEKGGCRKGDTRREKDSNAA